MKKKSVTIKLAIGVIITGLLGVQFLFNYKNVKPVISYNDGFLTSLMSKNMGKLKLYSRSYPGKENFFNNKIEIIDSVFGKVKGYQMLNVRKSFSGTFYTTYRVDFSKVDSCIAMFQIQEDKDGYKLCEVDINHHGTKKSIAIRPLSEKL